MKRVILVFARAPVPGETKTRLIPALGEEGAAALQQQMLENTLALVSRIEDCEVQVWCAPDTAHPSFHHMKKQHHCQLLPQQGNDLGERMAHAMQQALYTYRTAVVIGTDCPELTRNELEQTFRMLEGENEAVIGPAADGGYYLLGLKRFEVQLFHAIDWGTDRVLAQTLEQLEQTGMDCGRLAIKHDLDRPDDLGRFPELHTG